MILCLIGFVLPATAELKNETFMKGDSMPQDEKKKQLSRPTVIDIFEYQKLLGSGKDYDGAHLLTCYETKLWALNENGEWSEKNFNELTQAKFILHREILMEQIRTVGRFSIITKFENPCNTCNGAGEIIKFVRKTQKVDCMKCKDGKSEDGKKCRTCQGTKHVMVFGIMPAIRETTLCPSCKGKGFFPPGKQPDNPVIDLKAAQKFKKNLVQPEKNIAAIVAADQEPDAVAPNMIDVDQDKPIGEGPTKKIQQPPAD
jgi:ribosomal protein L40E